MDRLTAARFYIALTLVAILAGMPSASRAQALLHLAAGPSAGQDADASNDDAAGKDSEKEPTPEQKMQKRFPQPVRVGDLIGLPVLDDDDSTIGYVREIVRSPAGKISLIVPYSAWFGWARTAWGKRPVAVPIETVTILARQLDALEMSRDDFDDAPTWEPSRGQIVPPDEKTLIALGRR